MKLNIPSSEISLSPLHLYLLIYSYEHIVVEIDMPHVMYRQKLTALYCISYFRNNLDVY
jgi:hypothetical protein